MGLILRPLVELGVDEAYALLVGRLGHRDLPPLEAVENEDWGRDELLNRLAALSDPTLAAIGLTRDDPKDAPGQD